MGLTREGGAKTIVVPPEARLLGTRVHALTVPLLLDEIENAIADGRRLLVGHHNLHSLALLQDDPVLARYYTEADLVYADGMPVVAFARVLGYRFERANRMTSLDFATGVFERAVRGRWRVFYLGSSPGVIDRAVAELRARFAGLAIEYHHGHFNMAAGSAAAAAVVAQIDRSGADLLIVGMGMPRQEKWILENAAAVSARVIIPIGALADYYAGAIPTPPRWAGKVGLEWFFRLLAEPRRLGNRYLIEPWRLVRPFLRDLAGHGG